MALLLCLVFGLLATMALASGIGLLRSTSGTHTVSASSRADSASPKNLPSIATCDEESQGRHEKYPSLVLLKRIGWMFDRPPARPLELAVAESPKGSDRVDFDPDDILRWDLMVDEKGFPKG